MIRSRRVSAPTVALVGRTNVGKSTLFNRLLEERRALVSPVAGTTRDRSYGEISWRDATFVIVDTGGLDVGNADLLENDVIAQAHAAMKEADLILLVVDINHGVLPQDRAVAKELFASKKPVILVGNKADNPSKRANAFDPGWARLQLGEIAPVSAVNGSGVGDMLDLVVNALEKKMEKPEMPTTRIAIIGRPNVGKSSLVNRLCAEERMIVSEIAGTTREPQDIEMILDSHRYILVDTVGLRRREHASPELEKEGIYKTKAAIERAEVLFLLLDLTTSVSSQDRTLAGLAEESGKAVVLVGNKWDLLPNKKPDTITRVEAEVRKSLPFFMFAPIMLVSAKKGDRVDELLKKAAISKEHWQTMINEKLLDSFYRKLISGKTKTAGRPYIYRMRQTGAEPPTFALAIRGKEPLPFAFLRFVENRLREKFDFTGTPIRIRSKNIAPRISKV